MGPKTACVTRAQVILMLLVHGSHSESQGDKQSYGIVNVKAFVFRKTNRESFKIQSCHSVKSHSVVCFLNG